MNYKQGEFFLIEDIKNYKANEFIGEIINKSENNFFRLKIYIFPEDTKDGRQSHMSSNEIFSTSSEFLYNFESKKEKKVEVVSLEDYINIKYIKKVNLKYPLYFVRQTYSIEKNIFLPNNLETICFCQKIFNPDFPFKKCICGSIFHPLCFIQNDSSECWSNKCNYNLNNFLNVEEKVEKLKILKKDIKKGINIDIKFLNKKLKREELDTQNYKIYSENKIDLHLPKEQKSFEIIGQFKNNESNKINRDKGINIIYNILKEGLDFIKNNKDILYKYKNYKNKEIFTLIESCEYSLVLLKIEQLSEQIVDNLNKLYKNKQSSYFSFLQEFKECKKSSMELIIKIILGEFSPEQISHFKENDFLSDAQKKEKELKKKNEINKIKFKNDDKTLKLTLNKGRMLSEKEIFFEDKNNELNEINCNRGIFYKNDKEYNEKLKKKKNQFPDMDIEVIKMLIDLKEYNKGNIEKKLNKSIQDYLEIDEQDYFFEKRKIILEKEAKKLMKKNKNNNLKFDGDEKLDKIIKDISFDIQYF